MIGNPIGDSSEHTAVMTQQDSHNKPQVTIGLDVGAARIGVAIADSEPPFAVPKCTAGSVEEVATLLNENEPEIVVYGWPLELTGQEGRATRTVQAFIDRLSELLDFEPDWVRWDERLTTTESTHLLRAAGKNAKSQRAVIDQVAATRILQSYLDARSRDE